jgi:hypothetical protein
MLPYAQAYIHFGVPRSQRAPLQLPLRLQAQPTLTHTSGVELWNGKRLQTQVAHVAQDTITIRSLDWDRDRFDIEFGCVDAGPSFCLFLS